MEELIVPNAFVHADGLADVRDRHRVAHGPDRHQRASLATRRGLHDDRAGVRRAGSVVRGEARRGGLTNG